jgi:ABC-type nitrate/sulfonate/bicarbonate transport system substrate-binding protein
MLMAAMTLTIEPVRSFNGLDVLVARDEGLFAEEGLDLRIASLAPSEVRSTADGTLTKPTTSQGILMDRGEAALFQG